MEKRAFPKDDAPAAKRPRLSAPDGFAKSKAPPHSKIPAPVFVSAFSTADTSAKPVSTSSTSAFKPRALPAVSVTSAKPKSAPAREYRQLAVPPRPERDVQTPSSSKLTLPVPPPPPPAIVSRKNTASAPAPTIPAKPITTRPVFAAPPPSTPPKRRTVRTPFDFKTTPHTPTSAGAKVLKTISTTRFARSTDISREDGTLEVLGLFLQQNGVEHTSAADREVARGLEVTPQKPGVGARYMCGGLAELAHRTLSRDEMSLSLWAKEMETRSAHARPPAPEVYFRVQRVLLPVRSGARGSERTCLTLCCGRDDSEVLVLFSAGDGELKLSRVQDLHEGQEVGVWGPFLSVDCTRNGVASMTALLCSRFIITQQATPK